MKTTTKKLLSVVLTLALMLPLLTAIPLTAAAADDFITLTLGTPSTVTITAGARVEVRFTAPSAGTYVFESSNRGALDPCAYSAPGSASGVIDDESAGDSNYRFNRSLLAGEVFIYYTGVYANNMYSGSYTVTVTQESSYIVLSLGASTTIDLPTGARREVRFTAPSAGTYVFESSNSGTINPCAYSASSGNAIFDDDSGSGMNYRFERTLAAGELFTYYSGSSYGNPIGSYTVTVMLASAIVTPSGPVILALDTPADVAIAAGARREVRFTAPSAGTYRFISSNRGSLDPCAWSTASGGAGNILNDNMSGSNLDYLFDRTLAVGEVFTYYTGINGVASGNYTVTVTRVASKTVTVGTPTGTLTAGVAGTISFPVTTTGISNGSYGIAVTGLPPGVTAPSTLTINNNSGTLLLTATTATTSNAGGPPAPATLTVDGATSAQFVVTINASTAGLAISPAGQPVNRNITANQNTSFTVTATGNPTTYKWQLLRVNDNVWSDVMAGGIYSDVNTSTLKLTAVPLAYNGYRYRCIVGNAAGATVTSEYATLTVTAATGTTPGGLPSGSGSPTNIRVFVDGVQLVFDQPPIIQNGRTLVPLRGIFEALGAHVTWDGPTQTVTAIKPGVVISLRIGSNILVRNNVNITLDVPAQILNGRTLVPVRAIAESFGADVLWDGPTYTVVITS